MIGCWSDYAVPDLVRDLKANGLRAEAGYSPYVGHHTLLVHPQDVERAKTLLREIDPDNGNYIADECFEERT